MPPFFNLPIGPSGHSVRHGKTRSPKADLTTLLKMRRATQVHHEHARLSDRANVSHVRLPMRHQNFDFREGVGRPARPHGALELGRRRHPTKMSRSTLHRSRPLSALDRTPDGAGAPRDQAPRRDRACRTSAARFVALKKWSPGPLAVRRHSPKGQIEVTAHFISSCLIRLSNSSNEIAPLILSALMKKVGVALTFSTLCANSSSADSLSKRA
jgi:hypothetical protein